MTLIAKKKQTFSDKESKRIAVKLEQKRKKMVALAMEKGLLDSEVLKLSQEVDRLYMHFMRIQKK
ncbi:hypothetical protein PTI45_03078 [Paenibacillus nuruki]|uniref:Stage 0 sporulation regulatory protein n=1 Tax=Paenibacillus nuruki TaxID=1886670 RepID=A0A1E3L1A7_9BACL|nr:MULTISPECIES: aspartyl-phosphate phosphatase Spo0E family protein [Paenibacillus]ODP27516.1 hypothetical protein PTI45_03078 [Paenibacillus nuruki]TKJ87263.1 aspartyl-phosphate phosphatase Spo0E family protein [Paenibacillus sp. CFBP13512]